MANIARRGIVHGQVGGTFVLGWQARLSDTADKDRPRSRSGESPGGASGFYRLVVVSSLELVEQSPDESLRNAWCRNIFTLPVRPHLRVELAVIEDDGLACV